MQRSTLLITLLFTTSCGTAVAATPFFDIDANQDSNTPVRAIDAYPSSTVTPLQGLPLRPATPAAGPVAAASVVFGETEAASDTLSGGQLVTVGYPAAGNSPQRTAPAASGLNITDDSLQYLLQDFQARPLQKPARWSLYLLGIGFLLYQVRRRSMRAAIGFPLASTASSAG